MIVITSRLLWLLGALACALGIGTLAIYLPAITKPVSLLGGQEEE